MDFGMDFDVDFGRIFCRIFFAADFRIFLALAVDFCAGFFWGRIFWRRILFSITFATYLRKNKFFGVGFSDPQNPPSRRISDFRIFKIHRCGGFPDFCKKKSTVEIGFFDELCFFGWIFSKSTQNPPQNPRRNSQSIVEANSRMQESPGARRRRRITAKQGRETN